MPVSDSIKEVIDWGAFGSIVGVLMNILEPLSAAVGLFWLCLRVWESETVQGWRGKKKE